MKKIGIGLLLFFTMLLSLGPSRYWGPKGGVNSTWDDLITHIAISEHLKQGVLFPELNKTETSAHSVSKYLPVYHGILGFHIFAMLGELLGLPRLGSYALVLDLSLLAVCFSFYSLLQLKLKTGFRWEYIVATLAIVPLYLNFFSVAADATFFGQLLAQALLSLAVLAWHLDYKKLAAGLLIYATFTYPDFWIFLIPVFLFGTRLKHFFYWKVLAAFLWVILLYIPLSRAALYGPTATNLYLLGITNLILLMAYKEMYHRHRKLFIAALSQLLIGTILLAYKIENGEPTYYALKICAFSLLLFPYLLLEVQILNKPRGRILILCALLFAPTFAVIHPPQLNQFFLTPLAFTNEDYFQTLKVRNMVLAHNQVCETKNTVAFSFLSPGADAKKSKYFLGISNALLLNYDIYNFSFFQPQINKFFSSSLGSAYTLALNAVTTPADSLANGFATFTALNPPVNNYCLVVPAKIKDLYLKNGFFKQVMADNIFSLIKSQPALPLQ